MPYAAPDDPRHVASDDPRAVLVARAATHDQPQVDLGGWTDTDIEAFRAWAVEQLLKLVTEPGPYPGMEWRLTITVRAVPEAAINPAGRSTGV
jgi:hypothetical protein